MNVYLFRRKTYEAISDVVGGTILHCRNKTASLPPYFFQCIYCDDILRPISVPFPSRYQCTIDFNVSFSGRLPTYLSAVFVYLHTRTDCDHYCIVVLIYVRAINLFRGCLFIRVRGIYLANFVLRQTWAVEISVVTPGSVLVHFEMFPDVIAMMAPETQKLHDFAADFGHFCINIYRKKRPFNFVLL